jgi:uncharacterized Tic20 family protein
MHDPDTNPLIQYILSLPSKNSNPVLNFPIILKPFCVSKKHPFSSRKFKNLLNFQFSHFVYSFTRPIVLQLLYCIVWFPVQFEIDQTRVSLSSSKSKQPNEG